MAVASTNIELLIDAPRVVIWSLLSITYISVGLGVVVALVLKKKGSPKYARIGRKVD
ncbi:hypothetical protein D9M71_812090 [compost metagenome]